MARIGSKNSILNLPRIGTFTFMAAVGLGASAQAQTHVGNVVIDGSLCVGFDCPASPAFGFDTIILRENNLRILFDDSSTSAGFPDNDWRLLANGSASGAPEQFTIEDASAGRTVLRLEAGARENALVVESDGDIGMGTKNPATDMHVVTGNTPTLRLDQDGSSGFSPQTWDLAGNEAGFFIRDATNGSTLPFRIIPGASSNALVIDDDDDIGIGAGTNPTAALHVKRTDGTASVLIEEASGTSGNRTLLTLSNNGVTNFAIDNTASGVVWNFQAKGSGAFGIVNAVGAGAEFELSQDGDLTISGGLVTGTAGSCTSGTPCDAVFDPQVYAVPSIEDHAEEMWANRYLPAVGPTRAGEPVDVTRKMLGMLNELEHAHIYIASLNQTVSDQQGMIAAQNAQIEELSQRLSAIETR